MKPFHAFVLVVGFTASAHAWAVGPSFDCDKAQSFSERLICVNPDLAEKELAFVQAYYSLRQQVGDAGWSGLKREILDFERDSLVQCHIPDSGTLPDDMTPLTSCLADAYTKQRSTWVAHLRGPALEEASRSPAQNVALQQDLQRLGLLPASARTDGVYGAATRAAVVAWQQARAVAVTGFIGDSDAAVLERQVATDRKTTPTSDVAPGGQELNSAEATPSDHIAADLKAEALAYDARDGDADALATLKNQANTGIPSGQYGLVSIGTYFGPLALDCKLN